MPDIDFTGWPGEITQPVFKTIYGEVPDVGPGGGAKGLAKGLKWLSGFKGKAAETSIKKIGDFWKATAKVPGKEGSYTIYTKVVNNHGKTVKWFHDTFDTTGKFLHRGWTEGTTKLHLWWDGFIKTGAGSGPHIPK